MKNNNIRSFFFPIILSIAVVCGMFINSFFQSNNAKKNYSFYKNSKLDKIINLIKYNYVDSVSTSKIIETVIPSLLTSLDPHTTYIPAKNLKNVNEELKGNFGGIGIQYIEFKDTITVVRTIPGGPSEKAGILAGDRIIKVNDSIIAGKKNIKYDIRKHLKGKRGSTVKIGIKRKGEKEKEIKIIRDNISISSIDISYMINNEIGYIKVNKFSATTYTEFYEALNTLKKDNLKKLIIDLRGNTGGYLSEATKMINEFLEKGKMIVYTKGRNTSRNNYISTGDGTSKNMSINILIDEFSASASEIFAGAIQDNDRGKIIGRRSFGKGLVQEQRNLGDGSALRITVARYYTPTGRCIQKSYSKGKKDYSEDYLNRLKHNELFKKDSIHFDKKLKFTTPKGNVVYGGGGIMPDIFIPIDTSNYSNFYGKIRAGQYLYKYAFQYVDNRREKMKNLKTPEEIVSFLNKNGTMNSFIKYLKNKNIEGKKSEMKKSGNLLKQQLYSNIARNLIDDAGFYPIINNIDNTINAAIKNLK